jgi:hypothetical protein
MAIEVACGQCEGRLMVEQAGVIVACPHCGAHLSIEAPSEIEDSPQDPDNDAQVEQPVDESSNKPDDITEATETSTDATGESAVPEATVVQAVIEQPEETATDNETPGDDTAVTTATEVSGEKMPYFSVEPATAFVVPDTNGTVIEASTPLAETASSSASSETATPAQTKPAQVATPDADSAGITSVPFASGGHRGSRHSVTLLRNYAIAMTIAVVFLIYKLLNPNMSALESLPDVKPPKKDDKIVYKLVPEATEMPPGHVLSLGQAQRFGNLKVTPVRVTREPVEFVHHLGDTGVTREPGSDIVKLWFEFENLSADQHIAPLDGLVYKRDDNDWENIRSNNFVCRRTEKKKGGELVFVYELNHKDIWVLRDQHVDLEIAPGEKLETYIPTTEEGVAQLMNSDEPLIWRVHFRKGYSPQNYGVTTVIEVAFKSSDIGAAAPKASPPVTKEA